LKLTWLTIRRATFALAAIFIALSPTAAQSPARIVFLHNDQEPYVYSQNGEMAGFLYHYLNRIATEAGISYTWENILWIHQIAALQKGQAPVCVSGMYKTADREKFIQFTAPIGQDGGQTVIGRPNDARLMAYSKFSDLISDTSLRIQVQAGSSYGAYVDTFLDQDHIQRNHGAILRILRNVTENKFDYALLTMQTAQRFINKYHLQNDLAVYTHFPDLVAGELYYLGCSAAVSQEIMNKLNTKILEYGLATEDTLP